MGLLTEAEGVTFGPFDVTPQVRDLVGRLIIMKPTRYEAEREMGFIDEKTGAKAIKPAVWADILTLDASAYGLVGGVLEYGGDGKVKPNTDRIATPCIHKDVMIIQTLIVPALKDKMDNPQYSGFSVGVIYMSDQGTKGNPPYVFGPVMVDQWKRPRARGAEIMAFAEQQVSAWVAGSLVPHSVSELIVPAPHASPDVHKAYQERLAKRQQAGTAQPTHTPQPTATIPAQPNRYAPGAQATTVTTDPNDAVPPGWNEAAWANLDAGMREMIWKTIPQPTH